MPGCEGRNGLLIIFCLELAKGKIDCEIRVCMHFYARLVGFVMYINYVRIFIQ